MREVDFLARLGGDEFAVVVPEAGVKAREFARRLLGALHGSVEVDGVAVTVRASAGLVDRPRRRLRRRHLVAQGRLGHVLGKAPR